MGTLDNNDGKYEFDPDHQPSKKTSKQTYSKRGAFDAILKFPEFQPSEFVEGQRIRFILKLACRAYRAGVDEVELESRLRELIEGFPNSEEEHIKAIPRIIKSAVGYGEFNTWPVGQESKLPQTQHGMVMLIQKHSKTRFNSVTSQIEVIFFDPRLPHSEKNAVDLLAKTKGLAMACISGYYQSKVSDSVFSSAWQAFITLEDLKKKRGKMEHYNPFKQPLIDLAKKTTIDYNPFDRLFDHFNLIDFQEIQKSEITRLVEKVIVGWIWMLMDDNAPALQAGIYLLGDKNVGKTHLVEGYLVPGLKQIGFDEPVDFLETQKSFSDNFLSYYGFKSLIWFLDEMDKLSAKHLAQIKTLATSKEQKCNVKHRSMVAVKRRCLFIAASESRSVFIEEDERRWIPLDIVKLDWGYSKAVPAIDLFGYAAKQVIELKASDMLDQMKFTKSDFELIKSFAKPFVEKEIITKWLEDLFEPSDGELMTMVEISDELQAVYKARNYAGNIAPVQKIGREIKKVFGKDALVRTGNTRMYALRPRQGSRLRKSLEESEQSTDSGDSDDIE